MHYGCSKTLSINNVLAMRIECKMFSGNLFINIHLEHKP